MVAALSLCAVARAEADKGASELPASWPQVGGHWGIALPFVEVGSAPAAFIGKNFFQFGLTPGLTLKLDEHWAIDFEFIGFSRWEIGPGGAAVGSHTIWVVDPGLIYNFGWVKAGLRTAMQIGEGIPFNFGLVPIVVIPFPLSARVAYFLEFDIPVFLFARPSGVTWTVTAPLFQTGIGF
jgi:hypothetical protein